MNTSASTPPMSEHNATLPTALLVEDEPQIRRFVRSSLEEGGWQVFESGTLQRGLVDAGTRQLI
jgi:two-component system KDP operon response regulator KdpE